MIWLVAIFSVWTDVGLMLPGDVFPADETIAAELDESGSVRAAEPDEIPSDVIEAPAGEAKLVLSDLPPLHELRMAAIGAAVATLAPADFTQAGLPRMALLKARLDFDPKGLEIMRFKREAV